VTRTDPCGLEIQYDEDYMRHVEEQWTVEEIQINPEWLYFFGDESGHEKLGPGHKVFAIGFCFFLGELYERVRNSWSELRKDVFKVPEENHFHAKKHFPKVKGAALAKLIAFLSSESIYFVGAYIKPTAFIYDNERIIGSILESVNLSANQMVGSTMGKVERDEWYFEHSHRLNPKLMMGGTPLIRVSKSNGGIQFVRKSSLIAPMEIADLVSHVIGAVAARGPRNPTSPYIDVMQTLFSKPEKGICMESLSVSPTVRIYPDGTTELL
jgi:hypothetical protein